MKDQTPPRTLSIVIDDNGIHIDAAHAEDLPIAIEAAQRMTAALPGKASRGTSRVRGKNHDAHAPSPTSMRVLSSPEPLDDDLGPFSPETAADRRACRQLSLLDDDWLVEFGRGVEIEDVKTRLAALESGDSIQGNLDDGLDESLFDLTDPQTDALLQHEAHIRSLIGPDDDEEWDDEMDGDEDGDEDGHAMGARPASSSARIRMQPSSTRLH